MSVRGGGVTQPTPFHKQASGNIFEDDVFSFSITSDIFFTDISFIGFLTFSKKCMAIDDRPEDRARISKRLRSPGIDSKESMAYVAWRSLFPGSLNVHKFGLRTGAWNNDKQRKPSFLLPLKVVPPLPNKLKREDKNHEELQKKYKISLSKKLTCKGYAAYQGGEPDPPSYVPFSHTLL